MTSDKNSFIFYRSFFEASKPLDDQDKLSLFNAIAEFALNQTETELTPLAKAMFCLIKPQLQANRTRYENGKNGGRPKTETKPKDNQTETETKANKNVNANVNENGNVNEVKKDGQLEFEYLWELYGFKKDKNESLKVFKFCKADYKHLCEAITEYKNYLKATNYPQCSLAVWLRNNRWENDYKQLTEQHNASNKGTHGKQKHSGFDQQDYTAGTKGFIVG